MASVVDGDLVVRGNITPESIALPDDTVRTEHIDPTAPIKCDKQNHQYVCEITQPRANTVISGREHVHTAYGVGEVTAVRCLLMNLANTTGATITVALYKNGVSITSVVATIADEVIFTIQEATLTTATYLADDVFEVVITAAAGGGALGKGLVVQVVFREAAE